MFKRKRNKYYVVYDFYKKRIKNKNSGGGHIFATSPKKITEDLINEMIDEIKKELKKEINFDAEYIRIINIIKLTKI